MKEQTNEKPAIRLINFEKPDTSDMNDEWTWSWEYQIHNLVVDKYVIENIYIESVIQDPGELEDYNTFDEFMANHDPRKSDLTYDTCTIIYNDTTNLKPDDYELGDEYDLEFDDHLYGNWEVWDKIAAQLVSLLTQASPIFKTIDVTNFGGSEEGMQSDYALHCDIPFVNKYAVDAVHRYYATQG